MESIGTREEYLFSEGNVFSHGGEEKIGNHSIMQSFHVAVMRGDIVIDQRLKESRERCQIHTQAVLECPIYCWREKKPKYQPKCLWKSLQNTCWP